MSIPQEGTVAFTLNHEHRDWSTNTTDYNFGLFEAQGMRFGVAKHRDQTLEVNIEGPLSSKQRARIPVPPCNELGLRVLMTWGATEIKVYLNGVIAQTISV